VALGIASGCGLATEIELASETHRLREVGQAAKIWSQKLLRRQQLDGETIGLRVLGDMAGRFTGSPAPWEPEVFQVTRKKIR